MFATWITKTFAVAAAISGLLLAISFVVAVVYAILHWFPKPILQKFKHNLLHMHDNIAGWLVCLIIAALVVGVLGVIATMISLYFAHWVLYVNH